MREHEPSKDCWCEPEVLTVEPEYPFEISVHAQEN